MRSSSQRVDKYDAKTNAATVGLIVAQRLPTMPDNFAAYVNDVITYEGQLSNLLDDDGILPIGRGVYYAFMRKCYKAERECGGEAFEKQVQMLFDFYVARGVASATGVKIALDLFSVTVTP